MESTQVITFNYKMWDGKGNLIEESQTPVSIVQGQNQIFSPVEKALQTLSVAESKKVTVEKDNAFGDYRDELVIQVPVSSFGEAPKVGDMYDVKLDEDNNAQMRVVNVAGELCTMDANHPLAGQDLVFELHVTERRDATAEEMAKSPLN